MFFASDNSSGAAPEIMAAVMAANDGYAMPYGKEPAMAEVTARIRTIFEAPEAAVCLVATGTAANSLAMALMTPPWGALYLHQDAHANCDECGAPEFFTGGAKLVPVAGADAKMTPATLRAALGPAGAVSVHEMPRALVSLTNLTEAGTVYSPAEIAALTALARDYGLPAHLDGARFANALVAAGCTPSEMTWKAGIDVLSFGGTKNGCLGVEAVVIFDPAKAWELELRRKRAGHLFSKHRFLSAQMLAYLTDDLWLRLAGRANASGKALSAGIAAAPGGRLLHPTDANVVFAAWPRAGHARLRAAGARYHERDAGPGADDSLGARLVCSWSTTPDDIAGFLAPLNG